MRRRFKCDPKDHRQVSGKLCRTELPDANQARRTRILLPGRSIRLRLGLRSRREGRARVCTTPDRSRKSIRALPSGQNVANFSVATKARFKDRNGEQQERTEWNRVVAFGKLADNCQRLLSKGRHVYVEGRLTTRQYEAKDASGTRYRTENHRYSSTIIVRTGGGASSRSKLRLAICSRFLAMNSRWI
jgi:single-stranded DNA-binding protein